ncbi:hypothetical protein [Paenibacillus agricola]|uniref:Lipoprotein n=1 Tax=Paenibacillus agricola TaxID=2716264 RepID=A0ABX0IZ99_9BACL|nr:hypothetical protein [Paenibacillus agricola]NHN29317.1 hypothetical protein [Paenibacillus agricola]
MRTQLLTPLLALFLAIASLAGCTSATTPAPQNVKLEPATLQGQSEHWKVKVDYIVGGEDLEEITTLQFLGLEELTEASVTVGHKGQTPLTYYVESIDLLKTGQAITLGEKSKVLSWQDTEQIIIEWKVGGTQLKEYITPAKIEAAPAATPAPTSAPK